MSYIISDAKAKLQLDRILLLLGLVQLTSSKRSRAVGVDCLRDDVGHIELACCCNELLQLVILRRRRRGR